MKLVVYNAENQAEADLSLLRIVARAHDFRERSIRNTDLTVPAISVSSARTSPLPNLASRRTQFIARRRAAQIRFPVHTITKTAASHTIGRIQWSLTSQQTWVNTPD
jgi:hypothetical protein